MRKKLPFWLFILPLLAGSLLWAGWPAIAAEEEQSGYREGLQHLFPYYVPPERLSQASLASIDLEPLSGETAATQVFNFGQRQLELDQLGSTIFGAALYNASELDPLFYQDGKCGIAAWQCDGQRWLTLQTFSNIYGLNFLSLRAQLLFAKFELTALSDAAGVQGNYQAVYDDLRSVESFVLGTAFFMQNYLEVVPSRLEDVALQVYGYIPGTAFNDPDPEVELGAEVRPEPPPPPPNLPANNQPSVEACSSGRASGYIAISTAGDQHGPHLLPLTVVRWDNSAATSTTLAHRCLKNSLEKLLQAHNASVSAEDKLGGWVWRSNDQQIKLRKKHCGLSAYDIYEKPASKCSPPTSRPGLSSHQSGLAIDFYCRGSVLTSSGCEQTFKWLDCNAARYGLINLPSENWHWYFPLTRNERLAEKLQAGC